MAQTWGLEQWTNMDYFLISEPCTLSSMWSIIRALERLCVDFFSGKIVITSAWAPVYRRYRQTWVDGRAGDPPKRNSYCVEKGLWLDKKMYSRLSLVHWYIRQFSVLLWPASWVGKYQFLCNFPFIKCFPAKISNPFSMWNQLCRVRRCVPQRSFFPLIPIPMCVGMMVEIFHIS